MSCCAPKPLAWPCFGIWVSAGQGAGGIGRWLFAFASLLGVVWCVDTGWAATGRAAGALAAVEDVQAAFTLNLTRFITWPGEAFGAPDAPFVIGTFPRDAINDSLDAAVQGEQVNGHPVRTLRLTSLDDVAKCHAVFVSKGNSLLAATLTRALGRPILTISDADGFLENGGHVRLVPQPPHIKLAVSAVNLRRSALEPRAQLLRIAATP